MVEAMSSVHVSEVWPGSQPQGFAVGHYGRVGVVCSNIGILHLCGY